MEETTFINDILPPLECTDSNAQWIELQLLKTIRSFEVSNDDKVVPDYFKIPVIIRCPKLFGIERKTIRAAEGLGFHDEPVLVDLKEDFHKLSHSHYEYDKEATQEKLNLVNDTIGDLLPPKMINSYNDWHFGITQHVVNMMGMENMFYAIYDYPDEFHTLMQFITDDLIACLRWQENNNLLFQNNENDYMGGGSFCFNHELTGNGRLVTSRDTWGHTNSQETVGVSPAIYEEFIFPYYQQIAKEFGLLYYGCCEPVEQIWDNCLSKLPNLRKVSISAWCNEEMMAERLSGSHVIYSRKPSPNFIGVTKEFDEAAFTAYMKKTADLTKNCKTEYIFRDIYKLNGNLNKVKQAIEITRNITI